MPLAINRLVTDCKGCCLSVWSYLHWMASWGRISFICSANIYRTAILFRINPLSLRILWYQRRCGLMSNRPLDWSVPVSRSTVASFQNFCFLAAGRERSTDIGATGIIRPPVCRILPFLPGPDCLPSIIIISIWRLPFRNKEDEVVAYPADSAFDFLNNNGVAVRTEIGVIWDATSTRCARIVFFTSHACQMQGSLVQAESRNAIITLTALPMNVFAASKNWAELSWQGLKPPTTERERASSE